MDISIKTPEEIEKMRAAGRLAASVLEMIGDYVKPGVTTEELIFATNTSPTTAPTLLRSIITAFLSPFVHR